MRRRNFTSSEIEDRVLVETPNFSMEAKLHIFGGPGRDDMRKRNFTSLEVLTEKVLKRNLRSLESKKISNDQELIQSDPISCPQNQKGNN